MNKREKKKLYKNTLIKVKKLHPQKGDVVCMMPNFDEISIEVAVNFYDECIKQKAFNEATFVMIPYPIKLLGDKKAAQEYINACQRKVNKMED